MPGLRWAQGGGRWEEGDGIVGPQHNLDGLSITSQEGYPVGCRLIGKAGMGARLCGLWAVYGALLNCYWEKSQPLYPGPSASRETTTGDKRVLNK